MTPLPRTSLRLLLPALVRLAEALDEDDGREDLVLGALHDLAEVELHLCSRRGGDGDEAQRNHKTHDKDGDGKTLHVR